MAVTPNYSWPIPVATDYVKDGWDAIADLGNAIDTTVYGLPKVETVLSSGTFTAQSAVNLSSVLSDTYKFYNLSIYSVGSTGAVDFLLRFRENTTDKTTGYYAGGNYGTYTGSTGSWFNRNNGSSFGLFTMSSAETSTATLRIIRKDATIGIISGLFYDNISEAGAHLSGTVSGMTTFNGLTFYPSSGTMTGYYILTGVAA